MGICCSKKSTAVVDVLVEEVNFSNGSTGFDNFAATPIVGPKTKSREKTDLLSAQSVILGRHERTLRARQFLPYDAHTLQKPTVTPGQPWTDESFPHEFEKDTEGKTIKLTWKRPKDFTSDVRLFGNTINRYCAKQGQVSDCFFISTLSATADHPEYIKQMLPADAYETDPNKYTGIVHCRFWWMGEWIDVYTDDILPCSEDSDQYVGGHSDDKNIVWVPLVEKALARLYGSYPKMAGNQLEVFRLLTGGLVEDFKTSKAKKDDSSKAKKNDVNFLPADKLFERVDMALNSGSTVLANISEEVAKIQLQGLVSHHAYSVTDVLKVEYQKQVVKLLKIRNPWGEKGASGRVSDGEWRGRWSYTSTEWKKVDEVLRKQHNVHFDKDGEFWVCMEDFFKLFENLYIGDRIPHFDRDGFRKEDGLDKVINILGEWHGIASAGHEEKNKMRNPRFILTIPGTNVASLMSVVIEITHQFQNPANSKDDDELVGVTDIYGIEEEVIRGNRLWMSLDKHTAVKSDIGCRTSTYLCKLSPGDHLLVPYYYGSHINPPVSKSFCIRIFTNVNVMCSKMDEYPIAFYGDWNHTFNDTDNAALILTLFDEWRGETAAGNTTNKMRNPKFILNVPDIHSTGQHVRILLHLRCNRDGTEIPNSDIDVFKIEKDQIIEKRLWRSMHKITKKQESRFEANYLFKYDLIPGNYLLLPFFYDKEPISCQFCIRILASSQVQCSKTNEYPIAFYENWDHPFGNNYDAACILTLFGEWRGETAAGHTDTKMKNPKFILNIPDIHGAGEQATILLHLRCNQDVRNIPNSDIDVFKIEKDQIVDKRVWRSMHQITKKEESRIQGNYLFKYELIPGNYLLLPFFYDEESIECEFCIRILASCQVQCRPQADNPIMFVREAENRLEYKNQSFKLDKVDVVFGEWVNNLTAGGQISHNSFIRNPQYGLSIAGNAPQPVLIDLLQETVEPIHAVGCHIIQIDEDQDLPVGRDVLRNNAQMKTLDGETHPFMLSAEASGQYMLPPGRYLVLVYADKPTDEKKFALVIAAQAQSKIRLTEAK